MQMTVLVPLETRWRKIVQLVGPNRWMEKSPRVFLVAQFSAAPRCSLSCVLSSVLGIIGHGAFEEKTPPTVSTPVEQFCQRVGLHMPWKHWERWQWDILKASSCSPNVLEGNRRIPFFYDIKHSLRIATPLRLRSPDIRSEVGKYICVKDHSR